MTSHSTQADAPSTYANVSITDASVMSPVAWNTFVRSSEKGVGDRSQMFACCHILFNIFFSKRN